MDKLLEFVITHGTLNLDALSDMLLCLDDEVAHRFVMAVFGIDNYHLPEDFPMQVEDNGIVKTLLDTTILRIGLNVLIKYKLLVGIPMKKRPKMAAMTTRVLSVKAMSMRVLELNLAMIPSLSRVG